mmetsp:Transcript_89174/g.277221  ORF Transcript_89174/g.277221 Transcript_89174/m.277221 type:complete len:225 (-) Transcript_89174:673-1347(-)
MSRATMMVPVRAKRVFTGYLLKSLRFSSMGLFRSILTISPPLSSALSCTSGKYLAGSRSSSSRKTPSSVILALAWRSAEQETPMPIGQEAPCRGSLITRTSCTKYFPPYCAPMPKFWAMSLIFASHSRSRNARPPALPEVGSPSKYLQLANLTVFRFMSVDKPPTTRAKWYGGHAAVPMFVICSVMNSVKAFSFNVPLVFWKSCVLLALPPPFATNKKSYVLPC